MVEFGTVGVMDIARNGHSSPTAVTVVWRLFSGLVSMALGLWLTATSADYPLPAVTGLAMLWAGMISAGSVLVGRFSLDAVRGRTQMAR